MTVSHRIDWLDGWRAVAVTVVILSHVAGIYQSRAGAPGKLGVFIFFSISGYIVTRLLLRERAAAGRIDIGAFYLRRAARILPPLLLYIATMLALAQGSLGGAARAALFTCNIAAGPGECGWTFGHTWSLAFEEQFYLLLPLFLLSGGRWGFLLAIPLMLAPFAFPLNFIGRIGFLQIYVLLGLGVATAVAEKPIFHTLARVPVPLSATMLALSAAWMFLPPSPLQLGLGLLVPVWIGTAIFALPLRSELMRRWLASPIMRSIGLYSYSLYLWQQYFLADPPPVPWPLGIAGAVAISALSFYTLERWTRDWAKRRSLDRRRLPRRPNPAAAAPAVDPAGVSRQT